MYIRAICCGRIIGFGSVLLEILANNPGSVVFFLHFFCYGKHGCGVRDRPESLQTAVSVVWRDIADFSFVVVSTSCFCMGFLNANWWPGVFEVRVRPLTSRGRSLDTEGTGVGIFVLVLTTS